MHLVDHILAGQHQQFVTEIERKKGYVREICLRVDNTMFTLAEPAVLTCM